MSAAEPAWLQHQRQRWMRPDAARYLRPDAARWIPASLHHYLQPPPYERKYRPDQPRVPAGNPDGGQWTAEQGPPENQLVEVSAARRRGHHYFPRELFDGEPLRKETRKVFDNATTGLLLDRRSNKFDRDHRLYNEAVKDRYNEFLSRNNLTPQQMTPAHARTLLQEILESTDPRIRNLNMRILLREIMRRGPVRPRGND